MAMGNDGGLRWPHLTISLLQAVALLLAFSIPISVALDNLLLALLLLLGMIWAIRPVFSAVVENPVARAAWLLFGMLFVATLYGETPWQTALGTLGKYADLAFVPLFMVAARGGMNRFVMPLFMLAMGITLAISYLLGLGIIEHQQWMWVGAQSDNPAIFHSSITQNILMGYAAFLALLFVREKQAMWKRAALFLFALAAAADIVFLVIGRTGYLVLFALLMLLAWRAVAAFSPVRGSVGRNVAIVLLAAMLIGWGAYEVSSRLQQRVDQAVSEFEAWQPTGAEQVANETSTGARLEFYYNTLQIIRAHPLLGVGTGGFPQVYAKQVAGTGIVPAVNPHEEYLMLTAQAGLPALLLMLYWLYVQWREAHHLESRFKRDAAQGLVLTIMISCLVNSSLLDHVEGLFFSYMSAVLFADLKRA